MCVLKMGAPGEMRGRGRTTGQPLGPDASPERLTACWGAPGSSLAVCRMEYCPWVPEMDTSEADFFTIKPAVNTTRQSLTLSAAADASGKVAAAGSEAAARAGRAGGSAVGTRRPRGPRFSLSRLLLWTQILWKSTTSMSLLV